MDRSVTEGAFEAQREVTAEASLPGFFAWIHALERLGHHLARQQARGFSPLGGDGVPREEVVRFVGDYGTAFQPSVCDAQAGDVSAIRHQLAARDAQAKPPKVPVYFMGVAGGAGLLPLHYSRLIVERLKHKDTALSDFIDIFNHRIVALYYRAWLKYRLPYQIEQARLFGQKDPVSQCLQGLVGDRAGFPLASQLYFAGHYARRCKSASNLSALLSHVLRAPVKIAQFQGHWVNIEPADRAVLGVPRGRHRQERPRLGQGILLGRRYWDISAGITINIGPLSMTAYEKWLPGRPPHQLLLMLINRFVPLHIEVNLSFKVMYDNHSERTLGDGLSLKRTAWLQPSQPTHTAMPDESAVSKGAPQCRIANYRVERFAASGASAKLTVQ